MAIALLVVMGCQATPTVGPIEVELDDFYIEPASVTWAAGMIHLSVFNEGRAPHSLIISTQDGTQVVAALNPLATDETAEMSIELSPGIYTLTCRIVGQTADGQLVDHYARGMAATIEVKQP